MAIHTRLGVATVSWGRGRVGPSVPERDSITYMLIGVIPIVAAFDSPGDAGIACRNLLVVASVEK